MKLRNEDLIIFLNSVQEIANVNLPAQIAFAIKKNHRKILTEYKDYEDQLMELREKYQDWETSEKYNKEARELMAIETEIDVHKIPGSLFEIGNFAITAKQLEIIEFMIEIE